MTGLPPGTGPGGFAAASPAPTTRVAPATATAAHEVSNRLATPRRGEGVGVGRCFAGPTRPFEQRTIHDDSPWEWGVVVEPGATGSAISV